MGRGKRAVMWITLCLYTVRLIRGQDRNESVSATVVVVGGGGAPSLKVGILSFVGPLVFINSLTPLLTSHLYWGLSVCRVF